MEPAPGSTTPLLLTLDAPGGLMESARLALEDGTSTKKMSVFPSATSAAPGTKPPEYASPATTDLPSNKDNVSSSQTPPLSPKATFSAPPGLMAPVSLALKEASSTPTDSAFQLPLNAAASIEPLETA